MMKARAIIRYSTVLIAVLLAVSGVGLTTGLIGLLIFQFNGSKQHSFAAVIRVPVEKTVVESKPYVPIKGELIIGNGIPSAISGTWSNFRGDQYDAIYAEPVKLKKDFSGEKPPQLWGLPLGEGFAGAAVRNGRVYLLDYDMEHFRDALRCLSLDNGHEIWRFSYPVRVKKNHGMSRTVPAVTDRYCVSLGPKCHVLCVDAKTGEEKWFLDLQHDYGTTEPEWYAGQCPLIVSQSDGSEVAVLAPAGPEVLLMTVDCETGKEVWRTPNPFGWTMTHSSIAPMNLDGRKTFVYFGKGGVVGVDAADGKILWSTTDWQIEIATCPSPVILPDNRIFCCGGYLSGSVMLQIGTDSSQPGGYQSNTLYRLKDALFGSEQQTPIFFDNHLFGIRQRDKEFVCLSLDGQVVWHSGAKGRFGSGPYLLADGMFLILDDNGKLTACEASTAGYRMLFESEVLDDHGCWAPMAMVAGRLLLRDQVFMVCLDLREQ
ncbi:MAG: PQQ-like beta-propeller repeat protein [Planctomycetaceae bacterium]|jgi:outer membrane protein assembly factor BamB|nr:PQQ-like beta-propeller repeat protein [Planctomycetaceae bacterium]